MWTGKIIRKRIIAKIMTIPIRSEIAADSRQYVIRAALSQNVTDFKSKTASASIISHSK